MLCDKSAIQPAKKIEFFVPGIPRPGGSKSAFKNPKTGKIIMSDAGGEKTKNWRAVVALFAKQNYKGELLSGPLRVSIIFVMRRPKYHFRANGELRPTAPKFHDKRPDRGKLLRSTEDALTSIIWHDDSQVASGPLEKIYGDKPGAHITIEEIA